MKTTITPVTRTKIVIEASAEVFIVPNHSCKLNPEYMTELNRIVNIQKIMRANNLMYDYKADDVVQLWFTSKDDLGSENLGDHGFKFYTEDNKYSVYASESSVLNHLPKKMFEGLNEGETRTIFIPMNDAEVYNHNIGYEDKADIELRLTVTAAQTKYRYKNYGNFEEVFQIV